MQYLHSDCNIEYSLLYMPQAVLHQDPEYVIRRFESGRYAVNSECREIYLEAVELAQVRAGMLCGVEFFYVVPTQLM